LETSAYPASVVEIDTWRKNHGTTAQEAKRHFVQFVILASVSSSPSLGSQVAFKGGNALRFFHENPRSTLDLDFTAGADFPDRNEVIKAWLDASLKKGERQHLVKARCQSIHRNPSDIQNTTRPTYCVRVCYQLPADRYYKNFEERSRFFEVVDVEIR